VRADDIERVVWEQVEGFVRAPKPVLKQLAARLQGTAAGQFNLARELVRIERARNAALSERNKVVAAIGKGILTDDEAAEQIEKVRTRLAALDEEERQLTHRAETETANRTRLGEVEAILHALGDSIDSLDFDGRRHLVRRLVRGIDLSRDEYGNPHAVVTYVFSDPAKAWSLEIQEFLSPRLRRGSRQEVPLTLLKEPKYSAEMKPDL
jgi:hypothetical protein